MVKNEYFEQGKKEVLFLISKTLRDYLNIVLDFSSQEDFIKKLLSLLMERPCLLKFHKIMCKQSDLIFLKEEIEEFLRLFESGLATQRKFNLKKLRFDVTMLPDTNFCPKKIVSDQFTEVFQVDSQNTIDSLLEEIQRLKHKLYSNSKIPEKFEQNLIKIFEENSENPEISQSIHQPISVSDMIYYKLIRKQEQITQELEWEKHEIHLKNAEITEKHKKLKRKKRMLEERECDLRKQKVSFLKEKDDANRLLSESGKVSSENSSLNSNSTKISSCPQSPRLFLHLPKKFFNSP